MGKWIEGHHTVYRMSASSEDDRKDWIRALRIGSQNQLPKQRLSQQFFVSRALSFLIIRSGAICNHFHSMYMCLNGWSMQYIYLFFALLRRPVRCLCTEQCLSLFSRSLTFSFIHFSRPLVFSVKNIYTYILLNNK